VPRRQNSTASPHPVPPSDAHPQPQSPTPSTHTPKSAHVSDPTLAPFLSPTFDPATYLNATLPALKARTTSTQRASAHDVPLAELSTQTQTLLSQLSAHTARLAATLTQLTDEILRSGSRLAYEVEVLRGETLGLSEALTDGLQADIAHFVPAGIETRARRRSLAGEPARRFSMPATPRPAEPAASAPTDTDPPYIQHLRTLTAVRARLDTVITTFGAAMAWTFPPSEVSVSSGFLSVSAREPGSAAESSEERGQQVSRRLRDEIADLLLRSDAVEGVEMAAKRVEELKELSCVWKGTAEEKARARFVETLAKMVEERHRDLLREQEPEQQRRAETRTVESGAVAAAAEVKSQSAYGFINQLQKMRGGI